ncbi:MAG: hypothetical protein MAG451_01636 [Anaerolineales bacterium]|nr:hypothetical protein [Anaerolineales bacterium]
MFNEDWIWIIILLLLLGAILGQSALILIPILLGIVILIGWLWNRFVLRRTTYERVFSERRLFAGETLHMSVSISNTKPLPVPWLQMEDLFPAELSIADRKLASSSIPRRHILNHVASLGPYERVRWKYEIACDARGFYFFGPASLSAGDIFGVFGQNKTVETVDRLIVYPRVAELPELGFPGKEPFGEQTAQQRIFEDPSRTIGVREYRPEDSLRRVHWKATARQGDLQVKVYEPTITQQLVVFLNVATYAQPWLGVDRRRQEHTISIAASTALHATKRKFAVGLIANGSVPNSDQPIKVLPSRAPDQLTHILEALAAVTGFARSKVDELLKAGSPELAWGATFVVVTAVVTDDLLGEMMRLRDAGRRLVLVSTDPNYESDSPSGITVYHLPSIALDFAGAWGEGAHEAPQEDTPDDDAIFRGRWDGSGVPS